MTTAAQAEVPQGAQRLFIGTSNPTAKGGSGAGIFTAFFKDGKLTEPTLAVAGPSPSFLAVVPGKTSPMYAVLGGDAGGDALAGSYTTTSPIRLISKADAGGVGGCHVAVSNDGKAVLVANYTGGSVASFLEDDAGHLTPASFMQFPADAHGPVPDRQQQSHAHSALVSPDGDFVLVNDLGLDRIHIFRLERTTSKLLPHKPDHWASSAGAGPRHLVFHPNGKWIYCINELNATIDQLQWNPTHGTLVTRSTAHTMPAGVDPMGKRACEMVFSKDLRFLYAANRVHESFAVFAVDATTGALTHVQEFPNPGAESRHMAIDPSGKWLLSANQFSGDISVFPLDAATGKMSARSSVVKIAGPSCLLFL